MAVIVGSFVAGALIARGCGCPTSPSGSASSCSRLIGSVAVNIAGWPPKRGIDLSGGVVLVYEVDTGLTKPSWMPTALAQLNSDLNEGGGSQLEARPAGPNQIEIVGAARCRSGRSIDGGAGIAQLGRPDAARRRQAHRGRQDRVTSTRSTTQHKAVEMDKLIAAVGRRINPGGVKELTIRQYGAEQFEVIVPEVDEREVEQIKKRISTSGLLEFRIVANETDDRDMIKAGAKTPGRDVYIGGKLVGRWVQGRPGPVRLSERPGHVPRGRRPRAAKSWCGSIRSTSTAAI